MRIGCLGAARIVPEALVHPARVRGDATLQVVGAREAERAKVFAQEHGFAKAVEGYDAVVGHPDVDLVYVALPVSAHAEWSIRALQAGKHVLCEKPFAMNATEARAVLDAARANGRRVVEAFHTRYHPAFATMLGWISGGEIGRVVSIDAEFSVPIPDMDGREIRHRPALGGGAFMDLGCYPLGWTLSILDAAPEEVRAEATRTPSGVDETMRATLVFPGGARAELRASMAADVTPRARLRVAGEEGTIDFVNPLAPHHGARLTLRRGEEVRSAPIDRMTTYAHQLSAVLGALASGATLPTEGGATLRQQETLDSVYAAAGLGALRAGVNQMMENGG